MTIEPGNFSTRRDYKVDSGKNSWHKQIPRSHISLSDLVTAEQGMNVGNMILFCCFFDMFKLSKENWSWSLEHQLQISVPDLVHATVKHKIYCTL